MGNKVCSAVGSILIVLLLQNIQSPAQVNDPDGQEFVKKISEARGVTSNWVFMGGFITVMGSGFPNRLFD